jgi:GNAT superfamily N-acetyltransferase
MNIIKKHFYELTPKERSDLRKLTVVGVNGMREFLKDQRQKPHIYMGFVFLLYSNSKLIGWSAIIEPSWSGERQVWVYVKRKYRRGGIGTTLFKLAKRKSKRFYVKPWNETGYRFFHANKKSFRVSA